MKKYITGTRIVTKINMLRAINKNKCFLIVEGATDSRLYGKFINDETCEIVIAENKDNVIEAIDICNSKKLKDILGIVDSDFWKLDKVINARNNLFVTDCHDLECMLIKSQAFENILTEYVDKIKYYDFIKVKETYLKDALIKNGAIIGYIRWYSEKNNKRFNFDGLEFSKFIDVEEFKIDIDELINEIIRNSKIQNGLNNTMIESGLTSFLNKNYDLWHVCCGHDLIEILLIGLRDIFGSYNAKNLFPGSLEGSFRLAYEYMHFRNTQLYKSLLSWEKNDTKRSIFISESISRAI